jgi:peptidoglycan/LPS O-acetylase OafA/YrhL
MALVPRITQPPRHLHSLDALRGVAALTVVFWHWQHFFWTGDAPPADFRVESQPLFSVFFLFYRNGTRAVDLFFLLSGFIFFWIYASKISEGTVSAGRFFMLRFSRLYPLHLVTLLLVAAGQYAYAAANGNFFVYPANDAYHFVLNLLLIPSIGLERGGLSFNSPIWSGLRRGGALHLVLRVLPPAQAARAADGGAFAARADGAVRAVLANRPRRRRVLPRRAGLYGVHQDPGSPDARKIARLLAIVTVLAWVATVGVSYSDALGGLAPKVSKALALFPILVLFPLTGAEPGAGRIAEGRVFRAAAALLRRHLLFLVPVALPAATAVRGHRARGRRRLQHLQFAMGDARLLRNPADDLARELFVAGNAGATRAARRPAKRLGQRRAGLIDRRLKTPEVRSK